MLPALPEELPVGLPKEMDFYMVKVKGIVDQWHDPVSNKYGKPFPFYL